VGDFLGRHWDDSEVRADVAQLQVEYAAEPSEAMASPSSLPSPSSSPAAVVAYVHRLMDQDRKSTGLKSLQGKIWDEGYRSGELRGEVYPDVPVAMERWRTEGIEIAIFSSGSVQAQRSLFSTTPAGDLTRFIKAYFDTTTGPKAAPESYARIAAALEHSPGDVLFVSDVRAELDAARTAGMGTTLCIRKQPSAVVPGPHPVIPGFGQLFTT
jgi:enolase-phosphatase E1